MPLTIYVYENLPKGGASVISNSLTNYLVKNKVIVKIISDNDIQPRNFIHYLYCSLIITTLRHIKIAHNIDNENGLLVAHHSWLSKSPHLLRYYKGKKIYICQEVMREYYDKEHINLHDMKDKIINFLRLPIKILDRKNAQNADIIIANSNRSAELISEAYQKVPIVIYPGIDKQPRKKAVKVCNQVITIGSLNKYKNTLFLIKVIAEVDIEKRPIFVLIVNNYDVAYRKNILKFAEENKVKLKILYNVNSEKLRHELYKSKVFLYSPISEPFGLVILEAMAAGLPLMVQKNGGGYAEIISNNNGIMIDNIDHKYWALQLTNILEDNKLRLKYKIFNQKFVKQYSSERMNKKIFKLIIQQLTSRNIQNRKTNFTN